MARRSRRQDGWRRILPALTIGAAGITAGFGLFFVLTNTIVNLNSPRLGQNQAGINANALKPSQCAGLDLGSVTEGDGGGGNELILGSSGGTTIRGGGGNDCILGGGGNDTLDGGTGTDVCIGGPGNDRFYRTGWPRVYTCEQRYD